MSDLYYTYCAAGVKILGISSRIKEIVIPAEIAHLPVVEIGAYAFAVEQENEPEIHNTTEPIQFVCVENQEETQPKQKAEGYAIERIFLPDSIQKIGIGAFLGCSALTTIHLPENLKVIPERLFSGCIALQHLALPPYLEVISDYAFYDCRALERLSLPNTVQKLGKYACYNCRSMQQINIPATTTDLGTGLFLNCDRLKYMTFGRCRHISDLIAVLNHELHLTIDFGEEKRAKLLIPDFQYEYIEDTPARQFHQVNYGTGHLFRQCIGNSDIDFRRFDELFYLTRREDGAEMVLLLVMYRLEYPYRLQQQRKADYLQYLKDHIEAAFTYFASRNDRHTIGLLVAWGLIDAQNIEKLLEISGNLKQTEITGFLLEEQNRRQWRQEKTFDL